MTHLVIKHHSNLSLNFSSDNKELIFSDCEAVRDGWSQRDWSCQTDWLWGVMTGNTLLTLLTLLTKQSGSQEVAIRNCSPGSQRQY